MLCNHSQHHGMDDCPGLTEAEIAFGEKVKTISLNFVQCGGREDWHGPSVDSRRREMFENAEKYGNPPPEKV